MNSINKSIEINTIPANVWRVFIEPVITRQMGGEYVSDWKIGSSFGWKGANGMMYTNGTILEIEPGKLLKHNLFDAENKTKVTSVITYSFIANGINTILQAHEELNYTVTEDELKAISEGWDIALSMVKEIAEKL